MKPLGVRGSDEIELAHFKERGTSEPGKDRHIKGGHGEGGQHQVANTIE